jgi:hypothetical protein
LKGESKQMALEKNGIARLLKLLGIPHNMEFDNELKMVELFCDIVEGKCMPPPGTDLRVLHEALLHLDMYDPDKTNEIKEDE